MAVATSFPEKPALKKAGFRFDTVTRLKIRSLYLLQGLGPAEIAAQSGLKPMQIQHLAKRQGWTQMKRDAQNRIEKKVDALSIAEVAGIVTETAIKSEELGLATLFKAGDVLESERTEYWAKDVQSLSQAAKNFIGLARQARGLDASANLAESKNQILFVSLERIQAKPEKIVEEIHEIESTLTKVLSSEKDNEDGAF